MDPSKTPVYRASSEVPNGPYDKRSASDAVWRGAAALVVSDGTTSERDRVPQTDGGATLMPKTTVYQKLENGGAQAAAEGGLGRMPLTLWVIVAGVVLYLYIRRAHLGIDQHPGEKPAPPAHVAPAPTVRPKVLIAPTVPYRGGADVFTPN